MTLKHLLSTAALAGALSIPPVSAQVTRADCYTASNDSQICWIEVTNGKFAASINEPGQKATSTGVVPPSLVYFSCIAEGYRGIGAMADTQLGQVAEAICRQQWKPLVVKS